MFTAYRAATDVLANCDSKTFETLKKAEMYVAGSERWEIVENATGNVVASSHN